MMHSATRIETLRQAEADVRKGARHIERQRAIIAELERDGHDTDMARSLLETMEETQRLHLEEMHRLRNAASWD